MKSKLKTSTKAQCGDRNRKADRRTITQHIAEIETLLDLHMALYDEADIEKSSKARRKWTDAVVALSQTPAQSVEQAFEKVEYLRNSTELCLLPLALTGIVTDECFVVMRNMVADIQRWGLPLPRDVRH